MGNKNGTIELTVLGTRGSIPISRPDSAEFGGQTSCYMIRAGEETIFLDGGSGLVSAYSKARLKAHAGRPGEAGLPDVAARESDGRASSRIPPACGSASSGTTPALLPTPATGRSPGTPRAGARTQGS